MKIFSALSTLILLLLLLSPGDGQKRKDDLKVPDEIKSPSHAGKIHFPHSRHFREFDVECESCHHRIKAPSLKIPHRFTSRNNWKDCTYCHNTINNTRKLYNCRNCHGNLKKNYMKQVLNFKEAIHKSCESCHEIGKGVDASKSCKFCHRGAKLDYK